MIVSPQVDREFAAPLDVLLRAILAVRGDAEGAAIALLYGRHYVWSWECGRDAF